MRTQNPMGVCPYEVGDVLTTRNATDPSIRWPGTSWTAVESFVLGASASHPAGSTGGEETHTLTVTEMPKHTHGIIKAFGDNTFDASNYPTWAIKLLANAIQNTSANPDTGADGATAYVGGSQPHNNMPPYKAYYIWERTA